MTISTTSSPNLSAGLTAPQTRTSITYPDIAFIGKAGSGKTTAAQYLSDSYGYQRLSFAAKLKEMAADLWGPDAYKDRDKLQRLGIAVREIDPDAWVNVAMHKLQYKMPAHWPVVVDDCRFENEYWALKERGFRIVRIEADRDRRLVRLKSNGKLGDEAELDHVSETAIDHLEADLTITNDQTKVGFGFAVEGVLRRFGMELS